MDFEGVRKNNCTFDFVAIRFAYSSLQIRYAILSYYIQCDASTLLDKTFSITQPNS